MAVSGDAKGTQFDVRAFGSIACQHGIGGEVIVGGAGEGWMEQAALDQEANPNTG